MKMNLNFTFTLITFLFFGNLYVFSQWTNMKAPELTYSKLEVSNNGKNIAAFALDIDLTNFKNAPKYIISHDYGATWQTVSPPDTAGLTDPLLASPITMFWDGDDLFIQNLNKSNLLRKSSDYGATFTVVHDKIPALHLNLLRLPNGKWYYGYNGERYASTDKGITWSDDGPNNCGLMHYAIANNGNIVTTSNNGVSYSSNNGNSWERATFPSNDSFIDSDNSISKAPDGSLYFLAKTNTVIYKSSDNGVSWQKVNPSLSFVNAIAIICSGTDIISFSKSGGTFKSTDGCKNFSEMTPNAPKSGCLVNQGYAMTESSSDIFIAGQSAIYKYRKSPVSGINDKTADITINISPNPAQDFIEIENISPSAIFTLYNSLGGTIVNNENITGNKIDVSRLSSGAYLIKFQDNNNFSFKNIMISR